VHLTFGDQLRECRAPYSRPLFEAETLNLAQISLLADFVEVWRNLILFCSGGLVINRNPQFFTTFIVKAASVTFDSHV
jgi:hypothetical protein